MILTRNQFFFLALLLLLIIFFTHNVFWLLNSKKTTGVVWFTGHGNLGSTLGLSTYQVLRFTAGSDTIIFNGEIDFGIQPGSKVNILYQKDNPADAKINTFNTVWGESIVYCLGPLLILIAFFLVPDIIPKKSIIHVGGKGVIKILDNPMGHSGREQ